MFDGRINREAVLFESVLLLNLRVIHLDNSVVHTIRSPISQLVIAIIGDIHPEANQKSMEGKLLVLAWSQNLLLAELNV